jgi:hypothetical protein
MPDDPIGVVRHPEYSEPAGLGVNRRARGLTAILEAFMGDERDEKR